MGDGAVERYPRPLQARAAVRGVILLDLLANAAGAAVVVVYLKLVAPSQLADEQQLGLNLAVFALFVAVTVAVAAPINAHLLHKALEWVREGRAPTTQERIDTVGQPLKQTFSAFIGWMGAAVVFGALNDDVWRIAVGIALAGLVTCALLYALLERHFRPIVALALAGATLPRWRREITTRIMLAWWIGSAVPLLAVGLAPWTIEDASTDTGRRLSLVVIGCVFAGGIVMRAAAGAVSAPVTEVALALEQVEDGNLDVSVDITNVGELGRLQVGFNNMVDGLRERARLADLFGRQVGIDVAQRALEAGAVELGGSEREITALFVDLEGFTAFTEQHSPSEVVAELNAFFEVVIRVVMAEGGWVNKFEGDAALCIFGAPVPLDAHAAHALRAAAAIPAEVAKLPEAPSVGIGVATGRVVAGNVGTTDRYEYTVVGDAVNVASRLTEMAKGRATSVLTSEDTIRIAGDGAVGWRPAGTVKVRGRARPIRIFEPETDGAPATIESSRSAEEEPGEAVVVPGG